MPEGQFAPTRPKSSPALLNFLPSSIMAHWSNVSLLPGLAL